MTLCYWTYQNGDCYYDTGCGKAWSFETGDIKENGVKFCPFCGGRIQEVS